MWSCALVLCCCETFGVIDNACAISLNRIISPPSFSLLLNLSVVHVLITLMLWSTFCVGDSQLDTIFANGLYVFLAFPMHKQ